MRPQSTGAPAGFHRLPAAGLKGLWIAHDVDALPDAVVYYWVDVAKEAGVEGRSLNTRAYIP